MKHHELETATETLGARQAHVEVLLKALGNPSEWTFTGTVNDAGNDGRSKCACGHAIRYEFVIEHPARGQAHVGSTCIDHLAEITPELGNALKQARADLLRRIQEAEAQARAAAADAVNAKLWSEYCVARDEALAKHKLNIDRRLRSPHALWFFCQSTRERYRRYSPPKYAKAYALKRWLETGIKRARQAATQTYEQD